MSSEAKVIRITDPHTTVDVYKTRYIQLKDFGTFGGFIAARKRPSRIRTADEQEAKDRRKFGTCPGCGRKFNDSDMVHFAESVYKNGRCLGNLLACSPCANGFNKEYKNA